MEVHRGEVFYADLSPVVGSEQGGIRPVLIVQNEIGNRHSPTVIAAAITSRLDKARLPTHINIRAEDTGLAKDSVVLLEQIRTLDKHRLRERAGQITPEDQRRGQSGTGCQPGAGFLLKTTDEKSTKMPLPSGLDEGGICCFVEDLLFTRSWRIPLHRGAALARGSWPAFPR